MEDVIQLITVYAIPILFALTVHEAAHGYVARMFGDTTAYAAGRISLNPVRHIDPIGTVVVPLVMVALSGFMFGWAKPVNPIAHVDRVGTLIVPGLLLLLQYFTGSRFMFGWAKPVPVDFSRLRHPKRDMIWVAAAGPGANLVMAIVWVLFAKLMHGLGVQEQYVYLVANAGVSGNFRNWDDFDPRSVCCRTGSRTPTRASSPTACSSSSRCWSRAF